MLATLLCLSPSSTADSTRGMAGRDETTRLQLEQLRRSGDLARQRAHLWRIFATLTTDAARGGASAFESWYGEDRCFADVESDAPPRGLLEFSRADADADGVFAEHGAQSADTAPLVYTLYNAAAYRHIRRHRLFEQATLRRLRETPSTLRDAQGRIMIPPFPRDAMVVKTAWWPARGDGLTPLPVWDAQANPAIRAGNNFLGWRRVVAIDARGSRPRASKERLAFGGKSRDVSAFVALDSFHQIVVDDTLALRLQSDAALRKLAPLVLGRSLRAGDRLLLLGVHVATRQIDDWIWGTLWWHDAAQSGAYAAGRPADLAPPWRNYLLDVAFDASLPAAPDGGPHVTYNPWFEARFPDAGRGGGTTSNCMTCHRRASYPAAPFLPVTRGEPDLAHDAAFAADRVSTNLLWSLAMHARR